MSFVFYTHNLKKNTIHFSFNTTTENCDRKLKTNLSFP